MKQKNIPKLDEKDEAAVGLFVKLGMPKNVAKTLLYISQVETCCSSDIEQGTDLRQPEVSIAMQELLKKKWVKRRSQKTEGKGRPVHIYQPSQPLIKIWDSFQEQKLNELSTIEHDFSNLKNLIE